MAGKATRGFLEFLGREIPRKLKDHQCKAALHLLAVRNGANFSVPGSGKTTVVLTVFQKLRREGEVDSLFVVGPPACFGPWRVEYSDTLGNAPSFEVFAGGDVEARRSRYIVTRDSTSDLYLATFQTLQNDCDYVCRLFSEQGIRFYFVVDEAHYIKQLDGAWANAVLRVARHARRRVILTGTPLPRSYGDAFNLFDVLWPETPPIDSSRRTRIEVLSQGNRLPEAADLLEQAIGPLFYRVRKAELGLAPQDFCPPLLVKMHKHERLVYDWIIDRIREASESDYLKNVDLLDRLRRGRMMRLRQCTSYTPMLMSAVLDYNEDLLAGDLTLADTIAHYDELETPAKLVALQEVVEDLLRRDEKVVVWSNFVRALQLIVDRIRSRGHAARLIYGETPTAHTTMGDELTREAIIREFVDPGSGMNVLVANPAACGESVSLHKACSHAVYYDLSYNCAQYLQSLDRIHRVGGSEEKPAHYIFLQYEDTIDSDILANLQAKARRMSQIIDRDYAVYDMDMFTDDEEVEAYERIFGKRR